MTEKKSGSQCIVNGLTHYQRNKLDYIQRAKERKKQIKELIRSLKANPCMDCKKTYPYYIMDFDHREPEHKSIHPSSIWTHGWGIERIKEELEKCDLVCSNCHRERTFQRLIKST